MLLLRPTLPILTATSFLTSTFLYTHALAPPQSRRLLLDSASSPVVTTPHTSQPSILQRQDGQPVIKARTVRQISTGSIAGLLTGLTLSLFSRPLAILLGLLIAGVQFCESRGVHIIPYRRLERWVKGVDVRKVVRDQGALVGTFGISAALAGFGRF
ncbi:hypothetical protein EV356DRAFT_506287 [Viridothelium virens]|uniref:FUN14-domain-containing protein n=1 Tax=Viridothelium virens TaxID=1048519 RepID=A0A6A6H2V8_VIRVR|nr:hypothetical protein EV356DRAFT_506287 [Viridothelium virens]